MQGTEDTPAITSTAQAATITEDHGTVGSGGESGPESASGAIKFTDVDLSDIETSTFTLTQVNTTLANVYTLTTDQQNALINAFSIDDATHSTVDGTGTVGWHYNIDDSVLDFLGKNDVVTLTYTVKVDDGNGGTATQDVTITVQGTEDTPVIAVGVGDSAAATLTESYKTLSTTGTLTVTDADISDTVTAAVVTGVTLGGTTGVLTSADVLGMLSVTAGSIAGRSDRYKQSQVELQLQSADVQFPRRRRVADAHIYGPGELTATAAPPTRR